jgi:hypothetical protein
MNQRVWPVFTIVLGCLLLAPPLSAQQEAEEDSTGLPGDNFSLEGALEMFQKASSPEEFEKLINTSDNHVNNLDLNGDGEVDYVRVIGKMEKDAHAFVLQVPVSETESQDIAVIELEKTGNESAVIQIVGDEDIYGEQKIVEPKGEGEEGVEEEGDGGPSVGSRYDAYTPMPVVVVNVWGWPCVRYVYAPTYRVWVSPWRWAVYPAWWRPWRPFAWRVWHPFRVRHHVGFAVVRTHRVVHAHRIYAPHRTVSVTVHKRHGGAVTHYRTTRTVTRTKGGAVKVKTTRTKTTVKKRR